MIVVRGDSICKISYVSILLGVFTAELALGVIAAAGILLHGLQLWKTDQYHQRKHVIRRFKRQHASVFLR